KSGGTNAQDFDFLVVVGVHLRPPSRGDYAGRDDVGNKPGRAEHVAEASLKVPILAPDGTRWRVSLLSGVVFNALSRILPINNKRKRRKPRACLLSLGIKGPGLA